MSVLLTSCCAKQTQIIRSRSYVVSFNWSVAEDDRIDAAKKELPERLGARSVGHVGDFLDYIWTLIRSVWTDCARLDTTILIFTPLTG